MKRAIDDRVSEERLSELLDSLIRFITEKKMSESEVFQSFMHILIGTSLSCDYIKSDWPFYQWCGIQPLCTDRCSNRNGYIIV